MIFDKTLMFSDRQALTAAAASENVIDLGAAGTPHDAVGYGRNISKGVPIPLFIKSLVAISGGSVDSVRVSVQQCAASDFLSGVETLAAVTVPVALLQTNGVPLEVLPSGVDMRYLRLYYEPLVAAGTAATPTAGNIFAGVVLAKDQIW